MTCFFIGCRISLRTAFNCSRKSGSTGGWITASCRCIELVRRAVSAGRVSLALDPDMDEFKQLVFAVFDPVEADVVQLVPVVLDLVEVVVLNRTNCCLAVGDRKGGPIVVPRLNVPGASAASTSWLLFYPDWSFQE